MELATTTIALLKAHKAAHATIKLANRLVYHDQQVVFAREVADCYKTTAHLGDPLDFHNINDRELHDLITQANVRKIRAHGLRHTSATTLLQAGVPVQVVAARLGHSNALTWSVYTHVIAGMGQQAAATVNDVLFG